MPNATPTPTQIIIQKLVMLLSKLQIFFETSNISNPSQEEEKNNFQT
jgi:hypothetical protein